MSLITPQSTIQEIYQSDSTGTRASFSGDSSRAISYYKEFVDFISKVYPVQVSKEVRLLDVGCGCGWSSFSLSQVGYVTTGIDLNADAFEPPHTKNLTFLKSSALHLPFAESSFDIVASYQCVEHLPDPDVALREMIRVCKKGGIICIVGPNLLSPFLPIKSIINSVRRREVVLKRNSTTSHHPYGNTLTEHLLSVPSITAHLIRKIISRNAAFSMREPDTRPPFSADNDACYLCNPTDFLKFFPKQGCRIVQNGRHGRFPLSYLVAGGTWIAAQKCGP